MADQYIKLPDGSFAKFPDTMSNADIQSALVKGGLVSAPAQQDSGNRGALIPLAQKAIAPAASAAAELATNPNVPRMAATVGRTIGGIAPMVVGAVEGGPVGAVAGVAAAAKGAWAGGKTGWFTGKLAQQVAAPVASALEKLAPFAEMAGKVSAGFQQMPDTRNAADLLNDPQIGPKIRELQSQGMPLSEAARTVYNALVSTLKGSK